ncbi:DMT family transporter [Namhaeicola litoreus]|uniref:DMT family transporter n=1 Tax=Namhaeicola litoreus TaxID=1052145 RepID=A0ABW3XZB9_9FLAO
MSSRKIAFIFAFLASLFYGAAFTVAKDVMPTYIKPFGFILLRVSVAGLLFWLVGLTIKKEKIQTRDFIRIFLAAFFGCALNMLTFFKGLSMTTPISAAVIMVITPVLVLSFSALILKEKTTPLKILGIFIGLSGTLLLILYGQKLELGKSGMMGNFLVFFNAASYALYLILIRNLTQKYHPLTFAKWIYLFGFFLVLPFGFAELKQVNWQALPNAAWIGMGYIVLITTFLTYMFNMFALRELKATTLSIFIYLQPVIASIYAILVGSDSLNLIKVLATILIFTGVYLVTSKPKTKTRETT